MQVVMLILILMLAFWSALISFVRVEKKVLENRLEARGGERDSVPFATRISATVLYLQHISNLYVKVAISKVDLHTVRKFARRCHCNYPPPSPLDILAPYILTNRRVPKLNNDLSMFRRGLGKS